MKALKYFMLAALATSFSLAYSAGFETLRDKELSTGEMQALDRYLDSKHMLTNRKGNLTIDGEVQAKYLRVSGKNKDGTSLTGSGTAKSKNGMEARLYLNIRGRADRAWADARLRFVNRLGVVGTAAQGTERKTNGQSSYPKLSLLAANVGYFLQDDGVATWTVMGGRQELDKLFDSQLMYGAMMDGVTSKYTTNINGIMDFGIRGAMALVDEKANHFAYLVQVDGINLYDTGFFGRYSYTHWGKGDHLDGQIPTNPAVASRLLDFYWDYNISDFQIGYEFVPEALNKEATVFGEFIFNHNAKSLNDVVAGLGKQNKAWCIGAQLGKIQQKDDWLLQARYENVEAQSIPFWDVDGIGRGDLSGSVGSLASTASLYDAGANALSARNNYRGFIVQGYYALSDEVVGTLLYEQTRAIKKSLGEMNKFNQWEARVTYTF